MITEHDGEPIPGLPGRLPPGERILWQGAPNAKLLARSAFHIRGVALYFVALAALAVSTGSSATGVGATLAVGCAGIALLALLAWASARTTLYTLTDRRVVLRIGIALPTCINLPLASVSAIDLGADGDIALTVSGQQRLGYLALWPHARPWKLAQPQPMLRGLAGAPQVAQQLAGACRIVTQPAVSAVPLIRAMAA